MTSVGVVWSAVVRIKCLKELVESLPKEGEQLLEDLEEMKEQLKKFYIRKSGGGEAELDDLEKKIVRLSYEIVDAVVDASRVSKWKKSSANSKLRDLRTELNGFRNDLDRSCPGEEQAEAEASEMAATESPVQRPKNPLNQLRKFSAAKFPKLLEKMSSSSGNSEIGLKGEDDPIPKQQSSDNYTPAANFDELSKNLSDPLSEHSVVYIVGESGMGKTTFARKLLEKVESSFKLSAWVPMNHNFEIRRVLQLLLQKLKLGPSQDLDIKAMSEIKLIAHIFAALERNKDNLLVLDDIGAIEDWESIRLALPIANSTKVILTTSSMDFLRLPNSYLISGLTYDQIRHLLSILRPTGKTVSEDVEKAIFDISGGSPLFATILGKSFLPKVSAENEQQLVAELNSYKSHWGKPQVLEACYKRLAPKLKPCLLYLGQFPQGRDIQVEKLYHLLRAENLIIPPTETESEISLQLLTDNLKELADTSFVEMGEDNKSCRLHDAVREFCKSKGSDEEFFKVVDLESSTPVGPHTRRLALCLSTYGGHNPIQFQSGQDTFKKILSLLIFDTFESAEEKSEWPSEISDLKDLSHVRVVNFDGVDFTARKVPKGIDRLLLLRYLSFRGCKLEELPSSMANLTQLETLDLVVDAACEKMLIPSNIFVKMTRMVNLYLPRLYAASNGKTKVQLQGLERLEILVNFDTEACDVRDLSHFKKLKILSTISRGQTNDLESVIKSINNRGKELQHSSVDIAGFDCYNRGSASALENLLKCEFVQSIHIEGRIGELPKKESRAENVTEISLDGSEIEEISLDGSEIEVDPMGYLGKFKKLQSLVLANDAILGSEIVISAAADVFPKLRSMKLHNLQYLEKITIERGALPELSTLQIHTCGFLKELSIPKQLDDRLQKAQRDNGGDVYSVTPLPTEFNITT